jgi:hypothetical protein
MKEKTKRKLIRELPTIIDWFKLPFELWIYKDDPSYILADQVLSNIPDQYKGFVEKIEVMKSYDFINKKQETYLQKEIFRFGGEEKKWSFDVGGNISDFGKDYSLGFGYDLPIMTHTEIDFGAIINTKEIKDFGFYIGTSKRF